MNVFIFVFGFVVTIVACGAVGTIWWAALGDGETNDAARRGEPTDFDETPAVRQAI